jgi:uncharacterized protein YigE (DUF2233 family)
VGFGGYPEPRRIARKGAVALLLLWSASGVSEMVHSGQSVRSEWTAVVPGLWYRPWPSGLPGASPGDSGHAFRVDPKILRVTMLDARRPDRRAARVSTLREEFGAYLVVNGSFFDPEQRPLGLVVGNGREQSRLRNTDQGIFLIAGGEPRIQHTRDPLPANLEMAVQSFPRLVVGGRPLRLKPQVSRRTSVCLPGDGTVVIVVVPYPISLAELAGAMARPPAAGGLGCWAALNLDGGPSTQLSFAAPERSIEVEGGWPVPNGLAVLPR